jgi:hypothetical protein
MESNQAKLLWDFHVALMKALKTSSIEILKHF